MIQKLCFSNTKKLFPLLFAHIPRHNIVSFIACNETKEIHLFIIKTREGAAIATQIQQLAGSCTHGQCNKSEDNSLHREGGRKPLGLMARRLHTASCPVVSFLLPEAKARPPKQLQFLFSSRRALWSTQLSAMRFSCL